MRIVAALLTCVVLAACGGDTPTVPDLEEPECNVTAQASGNVDNVDADVSCSG